MTTSTSTFVNQRHAMLYGFSQAGAKGFTDEQAAKAIGRDRMGYWKRASELRKKDYLEPVVRKGEQEFRQSEAGGFQTVWKISPEGKAKLRAWDRQ